MKRSLMVLMLVALPAAAETKKPPALTATQKQTYRKKLGEGRKLSGQKKYAEAIVALQAALVANPGEPAVLSELGLAAYMLKDYAKAETWTRQAIANNATPSIKGAALYNLGLILEARHDTKGAIAAYVESLDVRPNSIVRTRLGKLSPDAAKATEPFAPAALQPMASVDAFCKALPAPEQGTCACTTIKPAPLTLGGAFTDAQIIVRDCPYWEGADKGERFHYLAVKVARGWFATDSELGDYDYNLWCDELGATATATTVDGKLAVTLAREGSCHGHSEEASDWTTSSLVIVGVGASTKPSATPPIDIVSQETTSPDESYDETLKGPTKTVRDVALTAKWDKDGTLHLSGKTKGLDKSEAARLTSPHRFAFP